MQQLVHQDLDIHKTTLIMKKGRISYFAKFREKYCTKDETNAFKQRPRFVGSQTSAEYVRLYFQHSMKMKIKQTKLSNH